MRHPVPAPPAELDFRDGLAYALFLPEEPATAGVVVLHGAGSCKESHFDFARVTRSYGLAALAFDQRGHGESDGSLGAGAITDVATMADLLRSRIGGDGAPVALRGSSMGGYMAIVAAAEARARAVVAICAASADGLVRGLRAGVFEFRADTDRLAALLAGNDALAAAAALDVPLMLLHAEGDEQVPAAHSVALRDAAPQARLVLMPGGHHRSIQHDSELQGESLLFITRALSAREGRGAG